MILADNLPILQAYFPKVWVVIKEIEANPALLEKVELINSRTQQPSLLFHRSDKTVLLHSKYNPLQEIEKLFAQYPNVNAYQHIFFYGVGLGYAVDYLARHYPGKTFTLFEPEPAILYRFLERNSLAALQAIGLTGLVCTADTQATVQYLYEYINQIDTEFLMIALPSYQQAFAGQYRFFCQSLQEVVTYRKLFLQANHLYEKKWAVNSIRNFKYLLETPNFLLLPNHFKNKPAVIVGAGPSLNEELENLRQIKQNYLAPIFAAGSGIVPLVNAGIYPDFACSYDPNDAGKVVYAKLPVEVLSSIPLLFGSCVGAEVIDSYPGPKYHFITSQDRTAPYYLGLSGGGSVPLASDGLTITYVLMHLLQNLGANPIVLVGQNLSYCNHQVYAGGIEYYAKQVNAGQMENAVMVEDVNGKPVATSRDFEAMLQDMERFIAQVPGTVFINTTQGGAKIKGTRFKSLQTLIEIELANAVEEGWRAESQNLPYDVPLLKDQDRRMESAYWQMTQLCLELQNWLSNFEPASVAPALLDAVFKESASWLQKIGENLFYQIYLKPMQTLELSFLIIIMARLEAKSEEYEKLQEMHRAIHVFLTQMLADFRMLQPLYRDLHDGICERLPQMQE